jgi:hypothetical protein
MVSIRNRDEQYCILLLAVIGTDLYAGGTFSSIGGVSASFGKWNGASWSSVGTGSPDGSIYTIISVMEQIYM